MFVAAATLSSSSPCFYHGKTYLQSQELTPDELATEPLLSSGAPT